MRLGNKESAVLNYREMKEYYKDCPPFLMSETLVASGVSIIAGRPKHGKSTVVRQIIKSVLTGEPFLGLQVVKGSVLYVQLEEHPYYVSEHFEKMRTPFSEDDLSFLLLGENHDYKSRLNKLKSAVLMNKPRLVVIDPLIKFGQFEDLNDYHSVYKDLSQLVEFARREEIHIILVHHSNKSAIQGQNAVLGSTALVAAVDSIITLKKEGGYGFIESEQRCGRGIPPTRFKMLDGIISEFVLTGDLVEDWIKKKIVDLIEKSKSGFVKQEQIILEVEGKIKTKLECLNNLVDAGVLGLKGSGRKSDPKIYFSLTKGLSEGKEMEGLTE